MKKRPIYDYTNQRWTNIDPERDTILGDFKYRTPDGVEYELDPNDTSLYRNSGPDIDVSVNTRKWNNTRR